MKMKDYATHDRDRIAHEGNESKTARAPVLCERELPMYHRIQAELVRDRLDAQRFMGAGHGD